MTNENERQNMKFWESVQETDMKHTKEVKYGSRNFTSIDAYWQIEQCTKLWGPYGVLWGLTDVKVLPVDGNNVVFQAFFFCPVSRFPIVNNCQLKDKDAMKAVFTDTLTKSLSFLGFSYDIFSGQREKEANQGQGTRPALTRPPVQKEYVPGESDSPFSPESDRELAQGSKPLHTEYEAARALLTPYARECFIEIINGASKSGNSEGFYENLFSYNGNCSVFNDQDLFNLVLDTKEKGKDPSKRMIAVAKGAGIK